MREAAHGLSDRGWDVEVLTTPARDHYTWADAYPLGATEVDGVTVRRFPLVREEGRYPGQADRGDLERRIAEGVPLDEEGRGPVDGGDLPDPGGLVGSACRQHHPLGR